MSPRSSLTLPFALPWHAKLARLPLFATRHLVGSMPFAAIRSGQRNSMPLRRQPTGTSACNRPCWIRCVDTSSTAACGEADVMDRGDVDRVPDDRAKNPRMQPVVEARNPAGVGPEPRLLGPESRVPFFCLPHLLEHQARRIPDAPAILAPGRTALTYRRLYQHIDKIGRTLRAAGIGGRDRVAVVLPNGPEMPVAVLAVAACAVCAPVNPALGAEELEKYFADLQPRALIAQAETDSLARRVALSRGIRVIELSPASEVEAGLFELTGELGNTQQREKSHEKVSPNDVALLLPTSGTT